MKMLRKNKEIWRSQACIFVITGREAPKVKSSDQILLEERLYGKLVMSRVKSKLIHVFFS